MTITAYKFKSFKILSPKKMEEEKIDIVPDRTEWKKNAYNTRNEKITTNIQKTKKWRKKTQHEIRRERKYKKEKIEQKKRFLQERNAHFELIKENIDPQTLSFSHLTLFWVFFSCVRYLCTLLVYTRIIYLRIKPTMIISLWTAWSDYIFRYKHQQR